MSNPEDLLYSASHEWAKVSGDEAVLGITISPRNPWGTSPMWTCPPKVTN